MEMDESKIIEDGRTLGFEGKGLQKYVEDRRLREEKRVKESVEREERRLEREDKRLTLELEVQKKREENELARARPNSGVVTETATPKNLIKLAQYKEGEDINVYLRNFERVRDANKWNGDVAISALINGFSGTKVSVYLDSADLLDYTLLKSQLVKAFGASIYDMQNRFRFSKQASEPISQFVVMLKDLLTKICESINVGTDFEKLLEFIIKDQLLRSVDKELAAFLKENNIFQSTLESVVSLAENYQAIHGNLGRKQKLFQNRNSKEQSFNSNFEKSGDKSFDKLRCFTCNEIGHVSSQCGVKNSNFVSKDSVTSENSKKIQCWTCKEFGHLSRNCSVKKGSKSVDNQEVIGISISNFKSHSSKLPVTTGTCNGRRVSVLRDTGSTAVLVKSSLVKPSYYTDAKITLRFADGRTLKVPLARIYVKSVFFNGYVEAACVENLPFDVLIGNVSGASCACTLPINSVETPNIDNSDSENEATICAVQTRNQVKNENSICKSRVGLGSVKLDMTSISTSELIDLQKNDPTLNGCFKKVDNISNSTPRFITKKGLLVRVANSSDTLRDVLQQIVLPKNLRKKVTTLAHDTVLSGHLGTGKTIKRVMAHFYWPGITGDIARYCRSCEICQRNSSGRPAKVPLVNLPLIDTPFARIAMDLIGPLPKSKKGNRFALVVIDMATKYPDAVALKNIDSHNIAQALIDIFSRIGLPKEVLHDQGTQFMSSVMKRFNEILQIKGISTTPYHPQCNGTCENFNKSLKQMIRKICDDEPEQWDKYLQPLLFAYREVPQCSTGFSPFELVFGHNVRGPLFLIKEKLLENSDEPDQIPVTEYVIDMRNRIKEFLKISNENESASKSKQKTYYDRNTRKRNFNLGDKVLLLLPTSSNKLMAEWKGPFEVVRRVNKVDYVVRVGEKERMYHVNMLRPFHERVQNEIFSSNLAENIEDETCFYDINEKLSEDEKERLSEILERESKVFDDTPGKVSGLNYEIRMDPKIKPISSLPYKVPYPLKDKVKSMINTWLEQGIIQKSNSEWSSPIVVVKNKDDSIRITVDFRKINPHVNVDNFPMPDKDVVIEKLSNSKFLTKLDLTKAFLQLPLSKDSRKYTSFVCEEGQFEFCSVPFGIRFASGLCNRVISNLLGECKDFVCNFIDDLMIHSESFEEHVKHVSIVLSKLNEAGITLNLKKCKFAYKKVKFLGFIVGNGKIAPDPVKVSAIQKFTKPVDKKHLRSFLGLLSFYRRFIPGLADHVAPLTDMLKKCFSDKLRWSDYQTEIFENARKLISDEVFLKIPNSDFDFVVQTDASKVGIGAVLAQVVDGEYCPIAFISRKLNKAECNYSVIEQECLAIKWAITYFYQYLYGGKFTIRTDHAPLTWLKQNKDKNSRLMRWALSLQAYDFTIEYVKGSENFLADMLSRYPLED